MNQIFLKDKQLNGKIEDIVTPQVIIAITEITELGMKDFVLGIDKAHNTGQHVIPIVVDSYGGEVYALLGMLSILQRCTLPIITIVESKAMSAGAVLFCMGNARFMAPYATLMFHDIRGMAFGKTGEVKSQAKEIERLDVLMMDLVNVNIGRDKGWLQNELHSRCHSEWFMGAQEAEELRLCTKIGTPCLRTEVNVKYSWGHD